MLRIIRVGALDGNTLEVELSNGHTLLVDMSEFQKNQEYAPLNDPAVFCRPQTDGSIVFWEGNLSISIDRLFSLVRSGTDE